MAFIRKGCMCQNRKEPNNTCKKYKITWFIIINIIIKIIILKGSELKGHHQ